jgi:hypothetical protein
MAKPYQPKGGSGELERGAGQSGYDCVPLGVGDAMGSGISDSVFELKMDKLKKRAKAEKGKYKRLLGRYRAMKEKVDILSTAVAQRVNDVYESEIPEGWEYLASATDELDRKFKLSVSNFEALLNQVSLARAINTVTHMTSRLLKQSRIVFNPRINLNEKIKDYLSQVARMKRLEFEVPVPRPQDQDILAEIKKEEKILRQINDFQDDVDRITENIARLEAGSMSRDSISATREWLNDLGFRIPQEWMIRPFQILKAEFIDVLSNRERRIEVDRRDKLRSMRVERFRRQVSIEREVEHGNQTRFLARQEKDDDQVRVRDEMPIADDTGSNPTKVEDTLSRIESMFSRNRR